MHDTEIPPLWLKSAPAATGRAGFALPAVLRLRARRGALAIVLAGEGMDAPLPFTFATTTGGGDGETLLPGVPTVALVPAGATRIEVEGAPADFRLGYYPVHKVALKLHAFANGRFEGLGLPRRWKAAGVAARTLRGALNALVSAAPARRRAEAARYRAFRARFVGDFAEVPAPGAAPRLSLLTDGGSASAADLSACAAALAAQTDRTFEWVVALPPDAPPALVQAATGARVVTAEGGPTQRRAAALAAAEGRLVLFLDAGAQPTRDAVALIRDAFAQHPDCALAYADEERLEDVGAPLQGVYHPAFNRHLMESSGYVRHFAALPRADALHLGLDPAAGPAAVFDLLLRHASALPDARIRHVPRVAVGLKGHPPGFAPEEIEAAAAALARLRGVGVDIIGRHLRPLYPTPATAPLVSIVVPTRDRAALLAVALRSLIARTAYRAFEIIIVDNGSVEPATFALFEEIKALWPATQVVRDDGDFNFPRICNLGVDAAQGEMILLLNNDVEVIEADWLDEMVALASLPGAGVVGAKLLFPDRTIQHAGVIAGLFRYADHWFAHSAADAPGYEDRLRVRQNLSAVTAACLLIRRDVWDAIGPLDAVRFAEDCNDIDLCLRARRAGFEVVWTPFATLLHYESASRGKKRSREHRARLKAQRARMEAIWHTATLVDPHYSPNLDRKSLFAAEAEAPEGPRTPRTGGV
ncbi:glycosyltransferase family 2 protein [Xanthobacter aminoxidans]|uniref:glycosyltransferase family 2 protein n=1 Tax=Xanthobacter aminoxidans TaxID=186280 RepID=UPI002022F806|nr:glycosyltransferase family 2 protein [Xanthobacter aminoxidans]MCL8385676.1 glycosyltransferase family 2 protein [Xanthobacter aminoxidans]